jgi:hypothetical protein
MPVSAQGLSKCNNVTDVGVARGAVASGINGVADLVTYSLYFAWKFVGPRAEVCYAKVQELYGNDPAIFTGSLRNGQACSVCRLALTLSIIYYDLFNCC